MRNIHPKNRSRVRCLSGALLLGAVVTVSSAAEFTGVGFLSGVSQSITFAVSGDGNVAVGESIGPRGMEAFRWTKIDGLTGLGFLVPSFTESQAFGVNADGSVIVGAAGHPDAHLEEGAPFRWTQATGMVLIPNLGGSDAGGIAEGTTPDGSLVVGWCASPTIYQPFSWSATSGTQGLGLLPDERLGRGLAVSADGSFIVGNVSLGSTSFPRAFRWTADAGVVVLPSLNPGAISSANAVTPDGSVIVGLSGGRAAMWTGDTVVSLGVFPDGDPAATYTAKAITADGSVVVGLGNFNAGQGEGEAFIWDTTHGIRRLRDVLVADFGLDLTGWGLFEANGISADGSVIVGDGFDPQGFQEGWVARLRFPLPGDMNCDGTVNFADINPFVLALSGQAAYQAQFPNCRWLNADCNGDGTVSFADINPFVALLSGG